MSQAMRLTDEEIVAATLSFGGEWRATLPTVDSSSAVAVARAAAVGLRSLVARGLPARPGDPLVTLVEAGANRLPLVVCYPASEDEINRSTGLALTFFGDEAGHQVLAVATLASGVNELQFIERDEIRRLLRNYVESIVTDGRVAVIIRPGAGSGGRYAKVRADSAEVGDVTSEGLVFERQVSAPIDFLGDL